VFDDSGQNILLPSRCYIAAGEPRVSLEIGEAVGRLGAYWSLLGAGFYNTLVKTGIVWLNMATLALPEHGLHEKFNFFTLFWKNRSQTAALTES